MNLFNATPSKVMQSYGYDPKDFPDMPDIYAAVSELSVMLMDNIDSSIRYGAVAAAIKASVTVSVTGPNSATIQCGTVRPSIYASVGLGGSADLAQMYNYGSTLGKTDAYFFKPGSGGFYLRDREGFRVHQAGHFLEKTARQFMAKYPGSKVTVT